MCSPYPYIIAADGATEGSGIRGKAANQDQPVGAAEFLRKVTNSECSGDREGKTFSQAEDQEVKMFSQPGTEN